MGVFDDSLGVNRCKYAFASRFVADELRTDIKKSCRKLEL